MCSSDLVVGEARTLSQQSRVMFDQIISNTTMTLNVVNREGAHIVGVHLHDSAPLQQVGITEGVQGHRTSLTVMYGPLRPLRPAELHVPASYEGIVRTVLAPTDWPRAVAAPRTTRERVGPSVLGSR